MELGLGEPEFDAPELDAPELAALLDVLLEVVEGGFVVAASLVVTAVTDVVETGMEEDADVVVTTEVVSAQEDVVVTAEAVAWEAEKLEQRPSPTDAAIMRSDWLQALMRQPATAACMELNPVPHWQASSESWQPATEMADVRQGIAHDGSPAKFCADTKLPATAMAKRTVFMLND